jgi:hypothetical protein
MLAFAVRESSNEYINLDRQPSDPQVRQAVQAGYTSPAAFGR